jgi:hypothetical protein
MYAFKNWTPWNRVLLQNQIVAQLVTKYPAIYRPMFTRSHRPLDPLLRQLDPVHPFRCLVFGCVETWPTGVTPCRAKYERAGVQKLCSYSCPVWQSFSPVFSKYSEQSGLLHLPACVPGDPQFLCLSVMWRLPWRVKCLIAELPWAHCWPLIPANSN